MAGGLDDRAGGLRRPGVARAGPRGVDDKRRCGPAGRHLRGHGVGRPSRADRAAPRRRRRRRGRRRVRRAARPRRGRARAQTLRVKIIIANDDVDGIATLLQDPRTTLGLSDAGAHVGQLCDAPLPTDLLGNWVRDRGALSVEAAVRKLTGQQADLFGFERPRLPAPRRLGRRRRVRPGHGRPRPGAPGPRLPGRLRAPHRRRGPPACATCSSTASPSSSTAPRSRTSSASAPGRLVRPAARPVRSRLTAPARASRRGARAAVGDSGRWTAHVTPVGSRC